MYKKYAGKHAWISMSIVLIIIAVIRYFYNLNAFPCFFDDEFQTVGAAYGYLKTGMFYTWDFVNDCISEKSYSRAWPYTIILANWIKLFGLSEVACRSLSAVLGIMTIISCIYITKKIFNRIEITFCSCIIILANTTITYYFRNVRMYALLIFVCTWMVYFIFKALMESNHIADQTSGRLLSLIKDYFDFNIKYVIISIILIFFAWQIHVNSLILLPGIFLFIIYKAMTDGEKKFKSILIFTCILGVMIVFGLIFREYVISIPVIGSIIGSLTRHGSLFANRNIEYLLFIMNEFGSKLVAVLFLLSAVVSALKHIREKKIDQETDIIIFFGDMVLAGIIFLVFVADRYYAPQYVIMLTTVSAMFYAIGYSILCSRHVIIKITVNIFLFMAIVYSLGIGYGNIYTIADTSDYINAYKTVSLYYDVDHDEIPVVHLNGRGYYYSQIWKNPILRSFDKANDMEIFLSFAEEYNEGILTCEKVKFGNLTQGVGEFIQNWSDRLSGEGVNNYNVEISHYNFLNNGRVSDENLKDNAVQLKKSDGRLSILTDLDRLPEGTQVVFVELSVHLEQETEIKKYYQLGINDYALGGCYEYLVNDKRLDGIDTSNVSLNDEYAVYIKGADELTRVSNK